MYKVNYDMSSPVAALVATQIGYPMTKRAGAVPLEKKRPTQRGRRASKLQAARDAIYREHILEVAEELFAEHGFDSCKMQDIARAASMSLGTLYQTFPGKQGLYRELLIKRSEEMVGVVMEQGLSVLSQPQSIAQVLWLIGVQVGYLLEHRNYLRIQLEAGYAWYHLAAQPSEHEQQLWARGIEYIQGVLTWGLEQGLIVPGDATVDQARLMLTMQQTRLANWLADGMQDSHAHVISLIQADFVRQFCRPQIMVGFLTSDGARINAQTRAELLKMDASAD